MRLCIRLSAGDRRQLSAIVPAEGKGMKNHIVLIRIIAVYDLNVIISRIEFV